MADALEEHVHRSGTLPGVLGDWSLSCQNLSIASAESAGTITGMGNNGAGRLGCFGRPFIPFGPTRGTLSPAVPVLLVCFVAAMGAESASEVWQFDSILKVGGHQAKVLGHPHVIDTPAGKAVLFNGVDDALFFDIHPLAGAEAFTWEVIFRPDPGGNAEQRFFHFQETASESRMLFETRIVGGQWCLDSFLKKGEDSKALLDREKLHPLGAWYDVAAVYDGREYRNYVDGILQGSSAIHVTPQSEGHCSVGTRIDKRDYFKGAISKARMMRRALSPDEFLKAPKP